MVIGIWGRNSCLTCLRRESSVTTRSHAFAATLLSLGNAVGTCNIFHLPNLASPGHMDPPFTTIPRVDAQCVASHLIHNNERLHSLCLPWMSTKGL